MYKIIPVMLIILAVSGCSSVREDFKINYLNVAPKMTKKRIEQLKFIAERELLNSKERDNYKIDSARIDTESAMPETHNYVFIHFDPVIYKPEIQNTTFLVIISRYDDRLVYTGTFEMPKGDAYYRYAPILQNFQ